MGKKIDKIRRVIQSPNGKNAMIFLVFILISAVLWIVQSLNEEVQQDLRCKIVLTNVPDSLTRVSPIPEAINVSVRAQGTQLVRFSWTKEPKMVIDYRQYKSGNTIQFGDAALKAFFRNMVGGGCQVMSVSPDSLSISFTSHKGVDVPIKVDSHITTAAQYVLVSPPIALIDTVKLYSLKGSTSKIKTLYTAPINLSHIDKSQVVKVPVVVPRNCRAIPDSVQVSIIVEPLISKTRKIKITPINVPNGMKLILVPSIIEVYYMVPMTIYKRTHIDPKFKVQANFADIEKSTSGKIPVKLIDAPKDLTNVFLSTDSVEFIIEK